MKQQLFRTWSLSGLVMIFCLLSGVASARQPSSCTGTDPAGNPAQAGLYSEYYAGYFGGNHQYFKNNTPGLIRTDAVLNFNTDTGWGNIAPPATSTPNGPDDYSVRVRGSLLVPVSGDYTLHLTSDDASYLWLDNATLANTITSPTSTIRNSGEHPPRTLSATVYLSAGPHNLLIHYGDKNGTNRLILEWESATIARAVVPTSALCTSIQPLQQLPQALSYSPVYNATAQGTAISSGLPTAVSNPAPTDYKLAPGTPAGISINANTGRLTAGPTVAPGTYAVSVAVGNGYGYSTFENVFTFIITPPVAPEISGTDPGGHPAAQGLYVEYYAGNFNGVADPNAFFAQAPARTWIVPQVDLADNWGNISPPATGTSGNPENFSARFRASLVAPVTGNYTFYLTADDGAILWLDNAALDAPLTSRRSAINNGGSHSAITKEARIFLTKGAHNLLIWYGEGGAANVLKLEWASATAGLARQVVAASALGTPMQPMWQLPSKLVYNPITAVSSVNVGGTSPQPSVESPLPVSSYFLVNAEDLPAGISLDTQTGVVTTGSSLPLGAYALNVAALNAQGATTFNSALTLLVAPPPPDGCSGSDPGGRTATAGLYGQYYSGYFDDEPNNQNYFATQPVTMLRTEPGLDYNTDQSWGTVLGSGTEADGTPTMFSSRYRGQLYAPVTGTYKLLLTSDDASYLWLDNAAKQTPPVTAQALINNGKGHPPTTVEATVNLTAGLHPILIHYGEFTGNNRLTLQWQVPDATTGALGAVEVVPNTMLCTALGFDPLPVELTRFRARLDQAGQVALSWATAQERNNAYFAVERSANGRQFHEIGRVAGHGSTTTAQAYAFADVAPLAGGNYYRLRQTDWDGTVQYSPVEAVTVARGRQLSVQAFPNPVTGRELMVRVQQPASQATRIEVLDLRGRPVQRQELPAAQATETTLSLQSLAKGVYLLRVTTASDQLTQKLLVP